MDHEIFDGIYFSNVKFSKLIKSKKSIPEIIEIIKYKVENLDIEQCTTDNFFLIKQNHQFLIEKGFEKEQSIHDFFEKLINSSWMILVWMIGYSTAYVNNCADLFIKDAKKAEIIGPVLLEINGSFLILIACVGVAFVVMRLIADFIAKKDEKYKEKMRIAYSILEKHFEIKIKSIKR